MDLGSSLNLVTTYACFLNQGGVTHIGAVYIAATGVKMWSNGQDTFLGWSNGQAVFQGL